jgi:uncharacterized protein
MSPDSFVTYVPDPTSSLTLAFDREGTHLAVTEKGRVDAEFIPVIRYAMFSEVYWHHTVRAFTTMVRRALKLASEWPDRPLTIENLLRWSDDRVLRELRQRGELTKEDAVTGLVSMIADRRPFVRMYTLVQRNHPELYRRLTLQRVRYMTGESWDEDREVVRSVFSLKDVLPNELLWDIPKRGKDTLPDLRIADLAGC